MSLGFTSLFVVSTDVVSIHFSLSSGVYKYANFSIYLLDLFYILTPSTIFGQTFLLVNLSPSTGTIHFILSASLS